MYAVQLAYSDDPDDTTRLGLRPGHRERLAGLAAEGKLLAGGPWPDDSGALLVFIVADREELDAIMAADPYYSAPGVTVTSVKEWSPVTRHRALDGL
ncbi:MAG TPA: YciI family protein [Nocardioides sp.]|uniref:YciI family protein n=1 Tax=Nocardioides sp. TaxID=35761 RepID=UPI002F3FD18D